jgi:membrane fusion protein (multidrug efflux system)
MRCREAKCFARISLLLTLLALTACSDKSPKSVAAASSPPSSAGSTSAVSSGDSLVGDSKRENDFTVSGPLIVEHQLDVLAQREGVIANLHTEVGAHVNAGDLLAKLENQQLLADLAAAQARTLGMEDELKSWQSEAKVLQFDYERAEKMWQAQLIPLEQYEHAKYKAEEEQWDVKKVEQLIINAKETQHSLELELDKTSIRAPFSGVVARRYVREGQQVAKGDRLFWVTGEGPLRMRFTLPGRFIGRIKKGLELPLTAPDAPEQKRRARIVEVSPVIDPSSSTFEVLVEVEGAPGPLRSGMDAIVSLDNLR